MWEVPRFFPSVSTSFLSVRLQVPLNTLERSTDGGRGRGRGGGGGGGKIMSTLSVSCLSVVDRVTNIK